MQSSPHESSNGAAGTITIPSPARAVEPKTNGHALAATPRQSPACKDFDPDLRDRLEAYRAEKGVTIAAISRELGYADGTAVTKYLGKKPEGNVDALEAKIGDFLKGISRRVDLTTRLFETTITRRLDQVTESLRRIGGVGLLYGSAGIGKTCACQWHGLHHATAVVLTINQWDRSPNRIETLLFEALDTSSYLRGAVRARWMIERLKGSRRPVIVDNAHRMTLASRRWLFDFAAQSGCPLVLVGEPAIYEQVRTDTELASFVRIRRELAFDGDNAGAKAREAAAMVLGGEPSPALLDLATQIIVGQGHVRALVHQVALMRDLLSDPKFAGDEERAFRAANTQMMSPAQLPAPARPALEEGGRN